MRNSKGMRAVLALGMCLFLAPSVRADGFNPYFYPANDLFANRTVLTGDHAVVISDVSRATREANEPRHATSFSPWKSLWWTWRAPFTGTVSFTACGLYTEIFPTAFDVACVAIYTGNEITALNKVAFTEGSIGNRKMITVSLAVTEGVDYQIAYDNFSSWGYRMMLLVNTAPVITSSLTCWQPTGETFSYAIQTQSGASSYGATGLPPGVTLNSVTGVISGAVATPGQYTVTLSATNAAGTTTATMQLIIAEPAVPTITSPAAITTYGGESMRYVVTGSNNPKSFDAVGLPLGLSIDTNSGVISGSLATNTSYNSTYTVTLSATNAIGTGQALLSLNVRYISSPPCLLSPTMATGTVGDPFRYVITGTRMGGGYPFNASNLPPGLSINTYSGEIIGTPSIAGAWDVPISAQNIIGTTTATLSVLIRDATAKSCITSGLNAIGFVGMPFSYQVTADQGPTKIWANSLPAGLSINTVTGLISGTPTTSGTYSPQLYADNSYGSGGDIPFTLMIMDHATGVPVITSPAEVYATQHQPFYYQVTANNKVDSYTAVGLPSGLSIDSTTGLISGIPKTYSSIPTVVYLTVTNSYGSTKAWLKLNVIVARYSMTSGAAVSAVIGQPFNYSLSDSAYNYTGLPPGLTGQGNAIVGTPTALGKYKVNFLLYDDMEGTITVTVENSASKLPVITSSAVLSAYVGMPFVYYIRASNNPTSYSATNLPVGWSVDSYSGKLSGTPTQTGTVAILLSATNATGTSQATLTLHIGESGWILAHVTSAAAGYGVVNQPYYYKLTMNQNAMATVWSLPDGLSFNPITGEITGTPTSAGLEDCSFSYAGSQSVNIAIPILASAPLPPIITSPAMASGCVNVPFSYQIGVSDPVNTVYSASPLPPGLKIDTKSGLISGVPTSTGVYSNIVIGAIHPKGNTYGKLRLVISSTLPPPVFTSSLMAERTIGQSGTLYQAALSNPAAQFTATGLPAEMVMDPTTGTITGTPVAAGNYDIKLSASDGNNTALSKVLLRVVDPNYIELIGAAGSRAVVGQSYDFTLLTSPPAKSVSCYNSNLPSGLTIDASSGRITGSPTKAGTYYMYLLMTKTNATSYGWFTLKVDMLDANTHSPLITGPAAAVAVTGETFSALFSSVDATSLTASNLPVGLIWTQADGTSTMTGHTLKNATLSGVATVPGFYRVPVTAVSAGGTTTTTFSLNVSNPQIAPPQISLTPSTLQVLEGSSVTFQATATGFPDAQLSWWHDSRVMTDATKSSLVLSAVVPADTGRYSVSASNACGKTTVYSSHFLQVLSSFDQWQARQFTPEQQANPAVSGLVATPQGDGVPNLLKYALNLDPKRAVSSDDASALPVSTVETGDTSYLALTYRQNKAATGIVYELQTSDDLLTWQTVAPDISEVVGTDSTTGDSVVRKKVQLNGETKKFIRLKVISP